MPLGDHLTQDFTFQIGEVVYGRGNNGVWLDNKSTITGVFDVPDAKTQDVVLQGQDGAFGNPDYMGVRLITIPIILKNNAEDEMMNDVVSLANVWAPVQADIDLYFQWPGPGIFGFVGRPRGAKVDLSTQRRGAVRALLRFDCLSPRVVAS